MSCQAVPLLPLMVYCWLLTAVLKFASVLATSAAVSRLGENGIPFPAAATIVPLVSLLVFQTSCAVYVVAAATGATVWTKAAFGEKVPAKPPLSFQPTRVPVP